MLSNTRSKSSFCINPVRKQRVHHNLNLYLSFAITRGTESTVTDTYEVML